MTSLKLFNASDKDFERNGIIFGTSDYDVILETLKLDWEDNNEDKVENTVSQVKHEFSKIRSEYPPNEVDDPIASFVILLK